MTNSNTYELETRYDSRKSFYKKAHVIREGNEVKLQSYNTIVAKITEDDNVEIYGTYSPTTLRHIKEFLYQFGKEIGTKSELERMYLVN